MKKGLLFLALAIIVISGMLISSCAEPEPEPAPAPAPAPEPEPTPAPAPEPEPTGPEVHGGILRIIAGSGPQVLSYGPEMGPGDHSFIMPGAENLVGATATRIGGGVEPVLCEEVIEDPENLKITWKLRKGIKFHDGTPMNAEAVVWDFTIIQDAGAMPYIEFLKEIEIVDEYTFITHLNSYSNQLMPTWGYWPVISSKAAFEKAAGGDLEAGKEWARANIIGTGPFILKEFKRDDHLTWVKNPDYWQPGLPYLDGIEVTIIPDPVTARAVFEAGDADVWGAPASDVKALLDAGFYQQRGWPVLPWGIWPNTAHPDAKFQDKRLREAVEYAIDKAAIAKAIGFGIYEPLPTLPWEGEWGYEADYNPRPYNPEKARELVAEAGYPDGCKAKLLIMNDPVSQDIGTALKQFLDEGGFDIELDIADPGRFFGTIYWTPPSANEDLSWWLAGGMDSNYLQTYMRWFSTAPFTDLSFMGHTDEQAAMDLEAQSLVDYADQEAYTKKLMRALTDEAKIIPVYASPAYVMQQPYVHSGQYSRGFTRWDTEEVWMEKH
jgi:peptide/nickel transport system substrate-binding protein